jgi:Glycosyl transferase family 2
MTFAPIALFVYNRLAHTRQTVEALQNNALSKDSDLIIFSDAPKSEAQAAAVREVRLYIHQIDGFKSVSIVERETNFGLARSIIHGVTSVVNERGRIIVLEDDLVVTPHFLDFMNRALDKYENEQQVIQVSGYMFPVKVEIEEDALFLPLTTSWGWATWKRAWQLFDPDAKGYAQVKADLALRKSFNLDGAYDYFAMLEDQLAGRVDSWAIRWQLSAFLNDSLTIYPRHSLIVNAGFDGSGTHGITVGLLSHSGAKYAFSPEQFPKEIKSSDSWGDICRALKNRLSILDRIKRKVKLFLSCFTKIEEVSN